MNFFDIAGLIGVVCIVLAFYLVVANVLTSNALRYLLLNLSGAILIMVSLSVSFNLAAFVLELFWALIACLGLIKRYKHKAHVKQ